MTGSFYINGQWIPSQGKEKFLSINPCEGTILWEGAQATEDEVNLAIESAKRAFGSWRQLSLEKRNHYLLNYREILLKDKEELALALSMDTGKPLWESREEIESMARKIPLSMEAYNDRCKSRTHKEDNFTLTTLHKPHGVIAVFGPFNFPGHLPGGHFIPALLAGNTIVFKGSELAPYFAEHLTICIEKAGFPSGVFNLLQGAEGTGKFLSSHPDIDGIFFTGSYHVGSLLKRQMREGKILVLEMGGNNPLVIADSIDNAAASYLTILSTYLTAGQRCSAAKRLIVIRNKNGEEFIKVLQNMVKSIEVGHYASSSFMGPVISLSSAEKLLNTQSSLVKKGGKILVEMCQLVENSPYLSPGLIDVTEIKNLPDEECFGPLLQLKKVADIDEAIVEANATLYGLTAGIVTSDPEVWQKFLLHVKAGVINWNFPTTGASSNAPFGGLGKSGNYRPSAYYAADYSSYPVASQQTPLLTLPKNIRPGIHFLGEA